MFRQFIISISFLAFSLPGWTGVTEDSCTEMPFVLRKGFVMVEASVAGVEGVYILDSGAPGLVMNLSRVKPNTVQAKVDVSGIGGKVNGYRLSTQTLRLQTLELAGIEAIAVELDFLEQALDTDITGLIGIDLFEGYDLILNYQSNTFKITRDASDEFQALPFARFDLTRNGHILIVEIPYGGRTLNFCIDTGSRSNYISRSTYHTLAPWDCHDVREIEVVSPDHTMDTTKEVRISGLIRSSLWMEPANFVVHDLDGIKNYGVKTIHGILGHEFLKGRVAVISKDRSEIAISLISPQMRASLVRN